MKDWLLNGAIREDEKLALDFAGPWHINRSNCVGGGNATRTC
jgi:hypothetical protein